MTHIVVQRATDEPAPDDEHLCHWAERALGDTPITGELVLRLVDAAESQELNEKYRSRNRPTNVLSFAADPMPELMQALQSDLPFGDLVICAEVVNAEALEQGKAPEAHWAHMVIHGCLHLLGHDHVEADAAVKMEALERRLLAELNFSDPYES